MAHRFVPESDESGPGSRPLALFELDHVHACAVLSCSGEIDVSTVSALRDALQEAERSSQRVIIDLTEVTFLDSTGVGAILGAVRAARGGQPAALSLVGPSGVVLRVLTITGLTKMIPVCASVEEAVAQPA
jgi:anti-sigma B factor antagonist